MLGPASSIDHALELLRDTKPDAAVLDIDLRGERVTPVALHLKALGVPFVLASAADPAALAQHPLLAEARNIGKPTKAGLKMVRKRFISGDMDPGHRGTPKIGW